MLVDPEWKAKGLFRRRPRPAGLRGESGLARSRQVTLSNRLYWTELGCPTPESASIKGFFVKTYEGVDESWALGGLWGQLGGFRETERLAGETSG